LGEEKSDEELAQADEDGEFSEFVESSVWNKALVATDEDGVPVVVGILKKVEENWRNRRTHNG
jgi:hypothetical protein